ncbi:MAG: cytochrome c3 family protein [Desulfobacterales bacterium]|nr:cytochrome c3 family protein [Desulfobacterales bacterium]
MLAGTAYPQDNVKLKAGAKGEVCLKCHEKFQKTIKSRYVHPLMKNGECTGCHVPHASSHKNLLSAGPTKLCYNCHKKVLPENANSAHRVVEEGKCNKCHNSHGSNNKFILTKSGNSLCLDCHKDMNEKINANKFNHDALKKGKGCLNCHDPHSSNGFKMLLKKDAPSLCLGCHKTDKPSFKTKHMNYAVADSNCNSCHNPHGSDKNGILFAAVHKPVSEKKCTECHAGPESSTPLKVKVQGSELCRKCHKDMMDKTFSKNRVHWPLMDNTGCLNCHSPHGAKQKMLLKGPVVSVCGRCHSDTVELQKLSIDSPENKKLCEPVKTGNCIICHSPHSSDNVLRMVKSSGMELCGECHEWQTHSTHPIGEKIIDQRNKNLTLDCYSCHSGCGTENNPFLLHFETTHEVCIQCHLERLTK